MGNAHWIRRELVQFGSIIYSNLGGMGHMNNGILNNPEHDQGNGLVTRIDFHMIPAAKFS